MLYTGGGTRRLLVYISILLFVLLWRYLIVLTPTSKSPPPSSLRAAHAKTSTTTPPDDDADDDDDVISKTSTIPIKQCVDIPELTDTMAIKAMKLGPRGLCPQGNWVGYGRNACWQSNHLLCPHIAATAADIEGTLWRMNCMKRLNKSKWVVFVGDHNMRKLYDMICQRLEINEAVDNSTDMYSDMERYDIDGYRFSFRFLPIATLYDSHRSSRSQPSYRSIDDLFSGLNAFYVHSVGMPPGVGMQRHKDHLSISKHPDLMFMGTGLWEATHSDTWDWDTFWMPLLMQRFNDVLTLAKRSLPYSNFVWVTPPSIRLSTSHADEKLLAERLHAINTWRKVTAVRRGVRVLDIAAIGPVPIYEDDNDSSPDDLYEDYEHTHDDIDITTVDDFTLKAVTDATFAYICTSQL